MSIELLGRKAISQLKHQYPNFPKRGFIAGGSIANLIWEYQSGNKAIINDIDVFLFDKIIDMSTDGSGWIRSKTDPKEDQKLFYHKKETVYAEDYSGLCATSKSKDFYLIESTSYSGIYNFVNYSANRESPQVIIDSFDINCTQVGYSIDEDRFYYSEEFEHFIKTGELQLTNLMSPAHSAIRLIKKKHDLNAKLDELELKLCQHCIINVMSDTNRRFFTEKYATNYRKYVSELEPYFILKNSKDVSLLFKQKGIDLEIFFLEVKKNQQLNNSLDDIFSFFTPKIFDDPQIDKISNGHELLFYVRNIQNDLKLSDVWKKLHYLYDNQNYVDGDFSSDDLDILSRLIQVAPKTIQNLKGLKLSEQISIIKNLFEKYKEDPIIAISIMEKIKIDPNTKLDEGDLLLLELSVRKQIINDSHNKVQRVLYPTTTKESETPSLSDLYDL